MKFIGYPFLKNLKSSVIKRRILSENFESSSKYSFEEDTDFRFSSMRAMGGGDLTHGYKERIRDNIPLILLGMDVGYNRMGLAVSNDMTGGFSHVDVLDTSIFRKALRFIKLAFDVRTSLNLVETRKKAAIVSFNLAEQLDAFVKKYNIDGALMSYPMPRLSHVYQHDYFDSREYAHDFLDHVGMELPIRYLPYSFQNEFGTTKESEAELVKEKNKTLDRKMTEMEERKFLKLKESRDWIDRQSAGLLIKRKFATETTEGMRSRKIVCKNNVCTCATVLLSLVPKLNMLCRLQDTEMDLGKDSKISRAVLHSVNQDVICYQCGVSIADHHRRCTVCAHTLCPYCSIYYLFIENKSFPCHLCEEGIMELFSIFPNLTKDLLETSKDMCSLLQIELEYDSNEKITKQEMHLLESTLVCLDDSIVYC